MPVAESNFISNSKSVGDLSSLILTLHDSSLVPSYGERTSIIQENASSYQNCNKTLDIYRRKCSAHYGVQNEKRLSWSLNDLHGIEILLQSISCESLTHFHITSGNIPSDESEDFGSDVCFNVPEFSSNIQKKEILESQLAISSIHSPSSDIFSDLSSPLCLSKNKSSELRKVLEKKNSSLQEKTSIEQLRDVSAQMKDSTIDTRSCLSFEAVDHSNYLCETLGEEMKEIKKGICKSKVLSDIIVGKPQAISTPIETKFPSSFSTFTTLKTTNLNCCPICSQFDSEMSKCCVRSEYDLSVQTDKIMRVSYPMLGTRMNCARSCPNIFLAVSGHARKQILTTYNSKNLTPLMLSPSFLTDQSSGASLLNLQANKNILLTNESIHLNCVKILESNVKDPSCKLATNKLSKTPNLRADFHFLQEKHIDSPEFHHKLSLNHHTSNYSIVQTNENECVIPTFLQSTPNVNSVTEHFPYASANVASRDLNYNSSSSEEMFPYGPEISPTSLDSSVNPALMESSTSSSTDSQVPPATASNWAATSVDMFSNLSLLNQVCVYFVMDVFKTILNIFCFKK